MVESVPMSYWGSLMQFINMKQSWASKVNESCGGSMLFVLCCLERSRVTVFLKSLIIS